MIWLTLTGNSRSLLWDLLEKPWTSLAAQYYAMASLFVVFISTLTFVLSTVEDAKVGQDGEEVNTGLLLVIEITDILCVAIFSLEYTVRFLCSPVKKQFVLQPMNLSKFLLSIYYKVETFSSVDFVALLPFYLTLVLEELEDYQIVGKAGKIVRLMRVMRILRVYKLFRHFAGLQSLLYTLQQAYKELGLLLHIISQFGPL